MTPNPRSFADPALASHAMKPSGSQATLSSDYSSAQSAEMSGGTTHSRPGHRKGELSGSGSDHVWSDIGSRRGTKSSIESGDSMHRSSSKRDFVQPAPANSPYVSGTWKDKAGKASSSSNTRPSLAGMFVKPGTDAGSSSASGSKSKGTAATVGATAKTKASRGTFDGSNSSSAAGRGTTDDDDDISDWDAESETGDQPSSLQSNSRYLTTPSTTTSSFDMLPTRLALTPENIVPLLEYAREVKHRLRECLTRLSPSSSTSTSATPSSGSIPYAYPSSSSRDYSSTTMTTMMTTTAGTTTLKRA
ncbi:hypothetical protein FRC17_001301 [Serendipita sp. 399]|nr:hypothetical protein FRC17_001301 [Serendipita sp. 399]